MKSGDSFFFMGYARDPSEVCKLLSPAFFTPLCRSIFDESMDRKKDFTSLYRKNILQPRCLRKGILKDQVHIPTSFTAALCSQKTQQ